MVISKLRYIDSIYNGPLNFDITGLYCTHLVLRLITSLYFIKSSTDSFVFFSRCPGNQSQNHVAMGSNRKDRTEASNSRSRQHLGSQGSARSRHTVLRTEGSQACRSNGRGITGNTIFCIIFLPFHIYINVWAARAFPEYRNKVSMS